MSIIVKGIEMPESCGTCFVGNRTICKNGCPLGALPNNHGRLADADEIRGRMESVFNVSSHLVIGHTWGEVYAGGFSDAIDIVKEAPTIVEAEDSECTKN